MSLETFPRQIKCGLSSLFRAQMLTDIRMILPVQRIICNPNSNKVRSSTVRVCNLAGLLKQNNPRFHVSRMELHKA